ncbi:ComEC/Rec2 family competence protein [Sporosarcina thermotolerans]|nr:ComEC/Rec2 family competence protein [Sporosarcina thermotolerans]WHT47545.1 ComEC/Rec2 family competence protein [Sporosarcina thermotolerans]
MKIDGGVLKGFAKTNSNEIVYSKLKFTNEKQKRQFEDIHIPSYQFTLSGAFQDLPPAAHDYSFNMENYLKANGAIGMFEAEQIANYKKNTGIQTVLSEHRWRVKQHIKDNFPESLVVEAESLLIGDRSGMDEELGSELQDIGHNPSVCNIRSSCRFIDLSIWALLIRLSLRKETVDTLLVILLPLYAVIAGGAPSVWRAVSVTVLILLTASGRFRMRMDDALAVSAACLSYYSHGSLFNQDFNFLTWLHFH